MELYQLTGSFNNASHSQINPILPLLLFAALLSAAATVIVGPLSFIGLIAPHIARLSGGRRPLAQMYLAAALGALLMVCADWLGRQLVFPEEIAAGLMATLLGGPYMVILALRRRATGVT